MVSVSVDTLKETRFYMYGEEWPNQKADLRTFHVCDSGILIMLRGPHPEYDEVKLVFLNFDGSERWEYAYSSVQHPTLPVRGIDVLQNMLYVIRETVKDETPKGLIEAFDINNGNLYWQKEVEGNIERFHFHKRLFVFTDKCRAYCFDTLTGEVLWELIADDCAVRCLDTLTGEVLWEYEIFGDCHPTGCWSIHCLCSCDRFSLHISDIVEGFIFMGVKNRLIVFSLEKDNSIHPGVFQIT
ncbi:MAG: PQQ-binding-like beta-propeller repeat protein [Theionarchaea archaeon]|nr:PQQ-binding-like beta-propeller repeat protein [Theionarchaea archaeon]